MLWIEIAERGESNLYMMDAVQRVPLRGLFTDYDRMFNLYENRKLQDVEATVRVITASHQYVVSVTVETTYFEN